MSFMIRVQGLTKQYGNILAVDHINLEVFEGEIFGLLGPNGAGKTTTIRMLTGQLAPTSGSAAIANHDITHQATKAKQQIGVIPDISNVYEEMSAWDNLIFASQLYSVPKAEQEKRAKELLEVFGLYERRRDRVAGFSRGMKRRLTIAAGDNPEKRKASTERRHVIEVAFTTSRGLEAKLKGLSCVTDLSMLGDKC